MPRPKKPRMAQLEEVEISREGDTAIIQYRDPAISTVHFRIGPELKAMTDQQVLDLFNDLIMATEELAASYNYVAVEVPVGSPQVSYFEPGHQWMPRGGVIRCLINDGGPANQAVIEIDGRDFSIEEFGRMLCTYAGWGMRVSFVPADEIDKEPEVVVREPNDDETIQPPRVPGG